MNSRFEEMNRRFEEMNSRFEEMNRRFEGMNNRLDNRFNIIIVVMITAWATVIAALITLALQ